MMGMYSRFMRSVYLALCALIAMPSATFCSWQQMGRAMGTQLLKHADKFVAAYVFNNYDKPQITSSQDAYLDFYYRSSPSDSVPHVLKCVEEICNKIDMPQPQVRLHAGPMGANANPYPTIYLNKDLAAFWEKKLCNEEKYGKFIELDKHHINQCKFIIHHEACHIRMDDQKSVQQFDSVRSWIDTGIYCGLTSVARACMKSFWRLPLLLAHIVISPAYPVYWQASMLLTALAIQKSRQRVEFRADDAAPATPETLDAAKSMFEGDFPEESFVEEQLQNHPRGQHRFERIAKRCEKAAKERVAAYHDAYKSTRAAIKI